MKTAARANWERALLVCGKCSRKLGGGFGPDGDLRLAKALRREPGCGKGRRATVGVAEVKCLGVCPKRAVVVVDSADPARWRLVRPGDDLRAVVGAPAEPAPPVEIAVAVSETLVIVEDGQASA